LGLFLGQPAALKILKDGGIVALSGGQENQPVQEEQNSYE
jgi:hypothetical protein